MLLSVRLAILLVTATTCDGLERSRLGNVVTPRVAVSRTFPSTPTLLATKNPVPGPSARGFAVGWAVCGMLGILGSAIKRLAPIAIQPLRAQDLTLLQWGAYISTIVFFAYVEGYKAFQLKFSPLVVRRAMTLKEPSATAADVVLGPFYSMGLFHATRKRKIVSWSVSIAIFAIVGVVKRLPYPWRSIIDAGVCAGLSWGSISMAAIYINALTGNPPSIDPQLP